MIAFEACCLAHKVATVLALHGKPMTTTAIATTLAHLAKLENPGPDTQASGRWQRYVIACQARGYHPRAIRRVCLHSPQIVPTTIRALHNSIPITVPAWRLA